MNIGIINTFIPLDVNSFTHHKTVVLCRLTDLSSSGREVSHTSGAERRRDHRFQCQYLEVC